VAGITERGHNTIWGAAEAFFTLMWQDRFDWANGDHHAGTPKRWTKMMKELTTPEEFEFTTFPSNTDEMIVIQDIPFRSLCAHHMIPFVGHCHIAYIPEGTIAGLSKFARLVKYYAADLTVQEELTAQIARALEQRLRPKGVGVVLRAEHMCMSLRGVQTPGTITTTSAMRGVFLDPNKGARQEFLTFIK
jgi:GTP cyclohydrolase I